MSGIMDKLIAKWKSDARFEVGVPYLRLASDAEEIFAEELKSLTAAVEAEESRGDLHSDLNRRTAEALGKPLSGDGSTWHDIPEKVAELRKAVKDARRQLLKAKSVFGATFEPRDLRMAEKYINAALEALEPG